mmetsp:Transcript_37772/g.76429  ORF Transcript_37772/g.76429 Transcript_37772/m.76429 type:complete len:100 (-) Transcript_37772:7-306(-)
MHRIVSDDTESVDLDDGGDDDAWGSDLPMGWMHESRSWLLVSKRYRTCAASFKRQLSICMLMYKLARRVVKEIRRLLQRSRVHEHQVKARAKPHPSQAN